MKRVLVSHAGGRIGLSFARALKMAPEPVHTIGVDSDEYHLQRAVTDEKYLVPKADHEDFLPILKAVIDETHPDLVWLQHESEIRLAARAGQSLSSNMFLPRAETIELAQDKMGCYNRLRDAGVPVPTSMFIQSEEDLQRAFREIGGKLWVRAIRGVAGQGSLPVDDYDVARRWIDMHHGWGKFMAAELLTNDSVTCESIWRDGRLIAAQDRLRMQWEFGHLTMSGVTGITGVYRYVDDSMVDEIADRAVRALDPHPHGIFGVDMAYDVNGVPKVTEINGGRFFSGGAIVCPVPGFNLPFLALQAALGEPFSQKLPMRNLLPTDQVVVRGMDLQPRMLPLQEVQRYRAALNSRHALLRAAERAQAAQAVAGAAAAHPVPARQEALRVG